MISGNKWLGNSILNKYNNMNQQIVLRSVDQLVQLALAPPLKSILYGDYTKWCTSLVFYPFNLVVLTENAEGKLTFAKNNADDSASLSTSYETDVGCFDLNTYAKEGFNMGEFYFEDNNIFTDYEPYSVLEIHLPFYGSTEIPIKDVIGKYIQFRLYVDFVSGQGMYVIGVNDNSIAYVDDNSGYTFADSIDDTNTRILKQIIFQIGIQIPVTNAGMVDLYRNLINLGVKVAADIATGGATIGLGLTQSTSTQKSVTTYNSVKSRTTPTGRLAKTPHTFSSVENKVSERTYDGTNYAKARMVSDVINTAPDVLNAMMLNPSSDKPNNVFLDFATNKSIKIVIKRAKVVPITSKYNHLYGRPLGEIRKIGDVSGYTEISGIHIEGKGFGQATQKELAMIGEAFSDGVIL